MLEEGDNEGDGIPPDRKLIGVKWVFKLKWDEHGAVSKHKAHLVVKGYVQ
jgi:hypothetical protein